jgi:hypothetical protein
MHDCVALSDRCLQIRQQLLNPSCLRLQTSSVVRCGQINNPSLRLIHSQRLATRRRFRGWRFWGWISGYIADLSSGIAGLSFAIGTFCQYLIDPIGFCLQPLYLLGIQLLMLTDFPQTPETCCGFSCGFSSGGSFLLFGWSRLGG